mgnify:CR=1 FL=1
MAKNRLIETAQDLAPVADRARETGYIAIDTEFVWERTYYPTLGIVQLGFSRKESCIVDTVAVSDLSGLGEILSDAGVVKILHDAQQDLTILRRATGFSPRNVFDTRLASGFAGLSSSLSLSTLLREMLGVKLAKTETRSDWLRRPLTGRQLDYALDDVRYLPAVRDKLLSAAEDVGHKPWLLEEMARYDEPSLYEENTLEEQFLRVKGISKLGRRRRAIVRELVRWREDMARKRNDPRTWVLADPLMIRIAQQKPQHVKELRAVEGLSEKIMDRYGPVIIEAVERALASTEREAPRPVESAESKDRLSARVDLAFAYIKGKSLAEGIDPALVASRAEVTSLVRETPHVKPEDHRLLRGWRSEFVGDELLQLLAGSLTVQMDPATGLPIRTLRKG